MCDKPILGKPTGREEFLGVPLNTETMPFPASLSPAYIAAWVAHKANVEAWKNYEACTAQQGADWYTERACGEFQGIDPQLYNACQASKATSKEDFIKQYGAENIYKQFGVTVAGFNPLKDGIAAKAAEAKAMANQVPIYLKYAIAFILLLAIVIALKRAF